MEMFLTYLSHVAYPSYLISILSVKRNWPYLSNGNVSTLTLFLYIYFYVTILLFIQSFTHSIRKHSLRPISLTSQLQAGNVSFILVIVLNIY
jgi:hypothetical protein